MIGILIQLAISWVIIWLFEKGNLSFLGFRPSYSRITKFFLFFFMSMLLSSFSFLLKMIIAKQYWGLNPNLDLSAIFNGIWYNTKSVLFEELIFRGVLFYILIKKLGSRMAIILSAIAFGIYHWFTWEVLGNPQQMLITFLTTASMGCVYAYGYVKSFSLYIPIAIHLGWNLVQSVVFSNSNIGNQVLVEVSNRQTITISYLSYYTMLYLPLVVAIVLLAWALKITKFKKEIN